MPKAPKPPKPPVIEPGQLWRTKRGNTPWAVRLVSKGKIHLLNGNGGSRELWEAAFLTAYKRDDKVKPTWKDLWVFDNDYEAGLHRGFTFGKRVPDEPEFDGWYTFPTFYRRWYIPKKGVNFQGVDCVYPTAVELFDAELARIGPTVDRWIAQRDRLLAGRKTFVEPESPAPSVQTTWPDVALRQRVSFKAQLAGLETAWVKAEPYEIADWSVVERLLVDPEEAADFRIVGVRSGDRILADWQPTGIDATVFAPLGFPPKLDLFRQAFHSGAGIEVAVRNLNDQLCTFTAVLVFRPLEGVPDALVTPTLPTAPTSATLLPDGDGAPTTSPGDPQ